MRALVIASLLACSLGCGPTTRESCVAREWSVRIDDAEVGHLCAMAIAPDETIVLLTGGLRSELVELEPDGSAWRRIELPIPSGFEPPSYCGHVAIAPDGERWATMAVHDEEWQRHVAIARVPVEGAPTSTILQPPEATAWAPTRLAFDGDVLRVAGFRQTGMYEDAEWWAFFGVIDRQTGELEIQQEALDLADVSELVPRADRRLIALVAEPTDDYSDGRLLSLGLDRGELEWQRVIENDTTDSLREVTSASGLDATDVVVGRRLGRETVIERYDAAGERVWQRERRWPGGVASQHVAVGSWIVELVSLFEPDGPPRVAHVEVLGGNGEAICTETTPLPFGRARRVVATRSGEAVIVAEDVRDVDDVVAEPGLWVTAMGLPEGE